MTPNLMALLERLKKLLGDGIAVDAVPVIAVNEESALRTSLIQHLRDFFVPHVRAIVKSKCDGVGLR